MMSSLENDLFSLLWTEIDFDDHPLRGGHGMKPEGMVEIRINENCIGINDNRIEMILAHSNIFRNHGTEDLELDVSVASGSDVKGVKVPLPLHIIALTEKPEIIVNPPENVHLSTLPMSWISHELAKSDLLRNLFTEPLISLGNPVSWRDELWSWRQQLSPLLPQWTWHLEFGNKSDRLGWYIRVPGNSLFTVFLGWGGLDNEGLPGGGLDGQTGKHGFFLFERAPLGQLDRPDEAEPNQADHLRTQHLFSQNGQLSKLVEAASQGDVDLAFTEVFDPHNGAGSELWPLVIGRCPPEYSSSQVGDWFSDLLKLLRPAIDYVCVT